MSVEGVLVKTQITNGSVSFLYSVMEELSRNETSLLVYQSRRLAGIMSYPTTTLLRPVFLALCIASSAALKIPSSFIKLL